MIREYNQEIRWHVEKNDALAPYEALIMAIILAAVDDGQREPGQYCDVLRFFAGPHWSQYADMIGLSPSARAALSHTAIYGDPPALDSVPALSRLQRTYQIGQV